MQGVQPLAPTLTHVEFLSHDAKASVTGFIGPSLCLTMALNVVVKFPSDYGRMKVKNSKTSEPLCVWMLVFQSLPNVLVLRLEIPCLCCSNFQLMFPSVNVASLYIPIRALSAASAAKFNIAPIRWQHPSHVAIVPSESKGKTEENDWDTACGNFKT
jgi:hypothetical protein